MINSAFCYISILLQKSKDKEEKKKENNNKKKEKIDEKRQKCQKNET